MNALWIAAVLALSAGSSGQAGYVFECIGYHNTGAKCTKSWVPTIIAFGDSQSLGYSRLARENLFDHADYRHDDWGSDAGEPARPTRSYGRINDGTSVQLLQHMKDALQDRFYTAIVFNAGNHDSRVNRFGIPHVTLDVYRTEIEAASQLAKKHASVVIWVDTMPIPSGLPKNEGFVAGGERPYNSIADEIAHAHGLYILHMKDAQHIPDNIHYTHAGSADLAKQVADCVTAALSRQETETCRK